MAAPEINQMREEVCARLRSNVDTWQYQLQARWGDPAVYAAEKEEMQRQDARVAYDLSRRNVQLLNDAYAAQAQKNTEAHNKRMAKRRDYRSSSKRPESQAQTDSHK